MAAISLRWPERRTADAQPEWLGAANWVRKVLFGYQGAVIVARQHGIGLLQFESSSWGVWRPEILRSFLASMVFVA